MPSPLFLSPGPAGLHSSQPPSPHPLLPTPQVTALRQYADDPAFQAEWRAVKLHAKERTAALVLRLTGEAGGIWSGLMTSGWIVQLLAQGKGEVEDKKLRVLVES